MSDFVILNTKNNLMLISGFNNCLYIYDNQNSIRKCDFKLDSFVQVMESIKIKNEFLILLGFESGKIELISYSDNKL